MLIKLMLIFCLLFIIPNNVETVTREPLTLPSNVKYPILISTWAFVNASKNGNLLLIFNYNYNIIIILYGNHF